MLVSRLINFKIIQFTHFFLSENGQRIQTLKYYLFEFFVYFFNTSVPIDSYIVERKRKIGVISLWEIAVVFRELVIATPSTRKSFGKVCQPVEGLQSSV